MIVFYSLTRAIILKNPQFGDTSNLVSDTKTKTMMNGNIRSRIATPNPLSLHLEFIELSRTKALEFIDFLNSSLGQKLHYTDPEGQTWLGQVLTNPVSITTTGRGIGSESRKESNSISIEFEGAKV